MERLGNWAIGLSILSWAVLGLTVPEDRGSIVRIFIGALHLTVGLLIICRAPVKITAGNKELFCCLPSLVAAGAIFKFASPTDQWATWIVTLFGFCTIWSVASLLFLGRSFAVFPSFRETKTSGPFSIVRHPAYLGECGMMACCALVVQTWWCWLLLAVAVGTVAWRILVEEKMLEKSDDYLVYRERVAYRLVPFVW